MGRGFARVVIKRQLSRKCAPGAAFSGIVTRQADPFVSTANLDSADFACRSDLPDSCLK